MIANQSQIASIGRTSQKTGINFKTLYTGTDRQKQALIANSDISKQQTYAYYNRKDSDVFKDVVFNPLNPFTADSLGVITFNLKKFSEFGKSK